MQKLILNSTQIPHIILREWMPKLNDTEFRIIMIIADQTYGWHKDIDRISYSQLVEKSGRYKAAITKAIQKLIINGYIEVLDTQGNKITTKEEARGKSLYYRICKPTSSESEQVEQKEFGKRTSESEHTKETNTKVLSKDNRGVVKKQPSCPLLNGSPLKTKYPEGHQECIEYFLSVEERRGFKFINKGKQFKCIHAILRAGFGFDAINKSFPLVEKKYGRGNWDFSTISAWIEKGSANVQNN